MTARIALGLALSYEPPLPPPPSGSDWDPVLDYPGVTATVYLPVWMTQGSEGIAPELRCEQSCCGEALHWNWGNYRSEEESELPSRRARRRTFRCSTLVEAELAARTWHAEGAAVIEIVLARREVRLAQRAAIIAEAHASHGEVTP